MVGLSAKLILFPTDPFVVYRVCSKAAISLAPDDLREMTRLEEMKSKVTTTTLIIPLTKDMRSDRGDI